MSKVIYISEFFLKLNYYNFQILTVLESEMGVASLEVQQIVEHIWREAIGEVDTLLAVPVSSIKIDQVINHLYILLIRNLVLCAVLTH